MVFFTFWALSNKIAFGSYTLVEIPLNKYVYGALSIFKGTGRIFYIVNYFLLILSILIIFKCFNKKKSLLIITLFLIIQVADTSAGLKDKIKSFSPSKRAFFLKDYIAELAPNIPEGEELHKIYKIVEEVMAREKGLYPNTDYPIALLFYLLEIPIPLYTPIFFASRTAGLVAHVIEQHNNNRLFRPRVLYTGPRGLKL